MKTYCGENPKSQTLQCLRPSSSQLRSNAVKSRCYPETRGLINVHCKVYQHGRVKLISDAQVSTVVVDGRVMTSKSCALQKVKR